MKEERRVEGEGREWKEKESMIDDFKSDDAKSEIKIQNSRGHEWSAENCSKSARKIIVVGIVVIVIVSYHSARSNIGIPSCNVDICAYIGFLVVIIRARGWTTSRRTQKGAMIRCSTLCRWVETATCLQLDRSRGHRTWKGANSHPGRQRRIASPPVFICTKAIDNFATDKTTGSRHACTSVSLLTRMSDVNSAADETISRRPRASRSGTHEVSGAMYRQMSGGAHGGGGLDVAALPLDRTRARGIFGKKLFPFSKKKEKIPEFNCVLTFSCVFQPIKIYTYNPGDS